MDALDSQIRQVYFFDTPDLSLSTNGVVVRGRRVQGRGDDTVVKLRPVTPSELPGRLRKLPEFGRRGRRHAGRLCLLGIAERHRARRRATTSRQHELAAAEAVHEGATRVLRAARSRRRDARRPVDLRSDLRAQAEARPEGTSVASSSPRCGSTPTGRASSSSRPSAPLARPSRSPRSCAPSLTERGVNLDGEQETKTRKALLYFAERAQVAMTPA